MKLLTTTAILVALSAPAWAIGDYDQTASVTLANRQTQTQTQTAKSTATATQHQAAYGGQGGRGGAGGAGGSVTVNNTYSGGASGSPTQAAAPLAAAPAAAASQVPASYSYSGGDTHVVAPPSIANVLQPASGDDCPGVGIGGGGSSQTGAGLLSYTWEGPHCTARRDAKLLLEMGHPLAAEYVLSQANEDVRKGLEWEARYAPQVPQPVRDPNFIGEFCAALPQECDGGE